MEIKKGESHGSELGDPVDIEKSQNFKIYGWIVA
jgi:hypothetical protein